MGYGFGYSSPWSLAGLVHLPLGRRLSPLACWWPLRSRLLAGARHHHLKHQWGGVVFAIKYPSGAWPDIINRVVFFTAPRYGVGQVAAVFPPTMALSQWRLCQWESPGAMAMVVRRTAAASEDGGHLGCQSRPTAVVFLYCSLHNQSSSPSVLVHTALGGGWPRWQPLNGAVQ